jgi:hypothetical protein
MVTMTVRRYATKAFVHHELTAVGNLSWIGTAQYWGTLFHAHSSTATVRYNCAITIFSSIEGLHCATVQYCLIAALTFSKVEGS